HPCAPPAASAARKFDKAPPELREPTDDALPPERISGRRLTGTLHSLGRDARLANYGVHWNECLGSRIGGFRGPRSLSGSFRSSVGEYRQGRQNLRSSPAKQIPSAGSHWQAATQW